MLSRPRNRQCRSRPAPVRGKAEANGIVRANKFHPTCRGIGDGMQAKGTIRNTGSPSGDRGMDQLATRERQAGPTGMAERLVVPMKPGNSGGRKGPQLKGNVRSDKGPRDWRKGIAQLSLLCSVRQGVPRRRDAFAYECCKANRGAAGVDRELRPI